MNTPTLNGRWDAAAYFENLTATNRLALAEGFIFCHVSGLEGFEKAVVQMQKSPSMFSPTHDTIPMNGTTDKATKVRPSLYLRLSR